MSRSQTTKSRRRSYSSRPPVRKKASVKLPPGPEALKDWFKKSQLVLSERQYRQLWTFHQMLRAKNAEYDLTRIYQFDNMVQKHYIDCILIAKYLQWKIPSPLLDLGTGAGFPGIPLKIACPAVSLILAEGRHKRVRFLQEVSAALDLKQVEIHSQKIYASFNRSVSGVITRAVETIPLTLARVRRCLQPGGQVIFMKGPHCDQEIEEARQNPHREYRLQRDIAYVIPHSPHQRRLVIFERQ